MKIYTSYFANIKNIKSDIVKISISRFSPKWFKGIEYKALAPSIKILNIDDEELFKAKFKEELKKLNPWRVKEMLVELSKGKDVSLLCYENPQKFCHRQVVAQWLSKHLRIEVKEYRSKGPGYTQITLCL